MNEKELLDEIFELALHPWISGIITTSMLIGGFVMRYIVIYAGQMAQVISS